MSGALVGLANFAGGFADSRRMIQEKKEREANAARQDAMLANLAKQGSMPVSYDAGAGGAAGGMGLRPGGTGTPGPSAAGGPSGGLFDLIDKTEGGGNYDTLFGHSQNGGRFNGVKVSDMTLGQLYDFTNPSGEYGQWVKGQVGRVATPMGRHQIVGSTLRRTAEAMGLSPDTKFTPQMQDTMANYLARQRLVGAKSPVAKRAAMRAEWEGFKHVSDEALDAAIAHFEATGAGIPQRPMGVGPA